MSPTLAVYVVPISSVTGVEKLATGVVVCGVRVIAKLTVDGAAGSCVTCRLLSLVLVTVTSVLTGRLMLGALIVTAPIKGSVKLTVFSAVTVAVKLMFCARPLTSPVITTVGASGVSAITRLVVLGAIGAV